MFRSGLGFYKNQCRLCGSEREGFRVYEGFETPTSEPLTTLALLYVIGHAIQDTLENRVQNSD